MKKKLLTLFCLLITVACFADDDRYGDEYPYNNDIESLFLYGKMGSMGRVPMTGVGVRVKRGYSGFDLSGAVMPMNQLNPLIYFAKASYLFFPVEQGTYLGVGGGVLKEPMLIEGLSAFGEGSMGYQWRLRNQSHIFLEGNVLVPYKAPRDGVYRVFPGLSFGIGF